MSNTQPNLFLGGKKIIASDITSAQVVEMLTGQSSGIVSSFGYAALNENKQVDSKYLPTLQKLSVYENNILKSEHVSKINFTGEYVQVIPDKSTVNVHISKPVAGAFFNTIENQYNSLVKNDFQLIDMIVPDVSTGTGYITRMYGDWAPGTIHKGINYYPKVYSDCYNFTADVKFWTDCPVYTPHISSYFQINVYDARSGVDQPSYIMITEKISDSTNSTLLSQGDNKHIIVEITDFEKQQVGYTFKPVFKFDLEGMLLRRLNDSVCLCHHQEDEHCTHHTEQDHVCTCHVFGGRFRIEIIHIINDFVQYKYSTDDIIYNTGFSPKVSNVSIKLNNSEKKSEMYCSGLKYLTDGTLDYTCEVDNLNFWTAVPKKIKLDSDLFNNQFEYSDNQFTKTDLTFNSQNNIFIYTDKIKQNIILSGTTISVSGTAYNGYGSDTFTIQKKYLVNTINECVCDCDCCSCTESTDTKEVFKDESKRLTNNGSNWNSRENLCIFNDEIPLMVVPNVGLCYPSGEYTPAVTIPPQLVNYNNFTGIGYYYRNFVNLEASINSFKYGGVFKLDGITEQQFNHNDFVFMLSLDSGNTWLNCKQERQIYTENFSNDQLSDRISQGIFAGLENTDTGIKIKFAFNRQYLADGIISPCIPTNSPLLLKLGFSRNIKNLIINKIELFNLDGITNW